MPLFKTKTLAKSRARKLGMDAAQIIEAAIAGDHRAQMILSELALYAEEGDPASAECLRIFQNVFALGEQKGAWGTHPRVGCASLAPSPHAPHGTVSGWAYNVPYRGIAIDAPSVKLRALYAIGVSAK